MPPESRDRPRTPPVVVQTSALDCGPASLSALLRGIGAPGSYEALRDVCATDVDGTSIDALEEVAVGAGTDAEQLVLPAEHILALPDEYLPAIVVIVLPDGFPHFVVAWRRTRRHVVVMDPAVGMRRMTHSEFLNVLYRHDVEVESAEWREWAGSEVFLRALRHRLAPIDSDNAAKLIESALGDPDPRGLATLDAAVRAGARQGPAAFAEALEYPAWDDATADRSDYSCLPTDDPGTVVLRGAVMLRAATFDRNIAEPSLAARLEVREPTPAAMLLHTISRPRFWIGQLVASALAVGAFTIVKTTLIRPLASGALDARLTLTQLVMILLTAIVGWTGYMLAYTAGRSLEMPVRTAWWTLAGRLPDAFLRTRPASDIIERGHLLHRVRELPLVVLRSLLSLVMVVGAGLAIAVVSPNAMPFAIGLAATTIAVPALSFRFVAEADVQTRTISGTLARFTHESIVGAETVASIGAGDAIEYEQSAVLKAWRRAQARFIRITTTVRVATAVIAAPLAAGCIRATTLGPAKGLLVALLVVLAIDAGSVVTDSLRGLVEARSSVARAAGPLNHPTVAEARRPIDLAADLTIRDVTVRHGASTLIESVSLTVPAGKTTAIVGRSGSGKSTLIAVLLGWVEPTSGCIEWDGEPLDAAALRRVVAWSAPETRIWNESLEGNLEYGSDRNASPAEERLRAAEAARIASALSRRGDGRLGDAGGALSDGEAQRVRFARALGRASAPLVVLDEPFRGLERDRRTRLLHRARATWPSASLVCVLHDIHDVVGFDAVVVMDGGRVIENGPPHALLDKTDSELSQLLASDAASPLDTYRRITLGGPS